MTDANRTSKTSGGKHVVIRTVGRNMHALEYDVDVEGGLQFRVSIPERRLAQGVPALDLAYRAVDNELTRREHATGIRYHIQLADHDPELG